MSRPRSRRLRDLPPNLSESRPGYYVWRDPVTGRKVAVGRDKRDAITQTVEANLHIAGLLSQTRLIDKLTGDSERTVADLIERYEGVLIERVLEQSTRDTMRQRLAVVNAALGSEIVSRVKTMHIADFLRTFEVADKKRSAQAYRSLLKDMFETGCKAGWIDSNPVTNTSVDNVKVKRARLTLADLLEVYEEAQREDSPAWVARSIELALVTGQRREDVRDAAFADNKESKLWVEQGKTGARIRIPDALRLNAIGLSVADVIKRCRDGVVSRYLIHHSKHAGRAKPGNMVRAATISQEFARCVRQAKARAEADGKKDLFQWRDDQTPPSFHELRSLSARLYKAQGVDTSALLGTKSAETAATREDEQETKWNDVDIKDGVSPQALLGHKSEGMTAVYQDARGAEWIDVRIA